MLLLAGCGGVRERSGAGGAVVPDSPAPAIAAVDRPPGADELDSLRFEWTPFDAGPTGYGSANATGVSSQVELCFRQSDTADETCPPPSAAELAKFAAEERTYDEAIRPADEGDVRVVASLALAEGGHEVLLAWHNRSGQVCWQADELDANGSSGGSGPNGPCARAAQLAAYPETAKDVSLEEACDSICLTSDEAGSDPKATSFVLVGTVGAAADALRVTLAGGSTATYPLVGPTIPGTDTRVFMAELGANDWRKLELARGGRIVRTVEMPALMAADEDCMAKVGPMPMPDVADVTDTQSLRAAMKPYDDALQACLKASGALRPSSP